MALLPSVSGGCGAKIDLRASTQRKYKVAVRFAGRAVLSSGFFTPAWTGPLKTVEPVYNRADEWIASLCLY
jgi:hypothetical protein